MIQPQTNFSSPILIFKTSITNNQQKANFAKLLDLTKIEKLNIDLDDCDKVLRIVTQHYSANEIINVAKSYGFECAELE